MLSRREIKIIMLKQYDVITTDLVEKARNGDAHFTPHEAIKICTLFLSDNPQLQRLEHQAAAFYKLWERYKIPPTRKKDIHGQLQLGFDYKPSGLIIYGKKERGFMHDMTVPNILKRMKILQDSLKNTTDGIHAELVSYTEWLEGFDQSKYKILDEVMRQVFGWQEPPEQPEEPDDDDVL
jgi:hypothetical protein